MRHHNQIKKDQPKTDMEIMTEEFLDALVARRAKHFSVWFPDPIECERNYDKLPQSAVDEELAEITDPAVLEAVYDYSFSIIQEREITHEELCAIQEKVRREAIEKAAAAENADSLAMPELAPAPVLGYDPILEDARRHDKEQVEKDLRAGKAKMI